MSDAYLIARHAARIGDEALIIRHRFAQNADTIEECYFHWRDSQAARFANNVEEPQNEVFGKLSHALVQIEETIKDTGVAGDQAENLAVAISAAYEPCRERAAACVSSAEASMYHAEEATSLAAKAEAEVQRLNSELSRLGNPPL